MTLLTDPMGAWLWRATWQSAVLIGVVMVVQGVFGRRMEPRWRHALWFVVMLRLVIPVSPSSGWSLFNLIQGKPVESVRRYSPAVLVRKQFVTIVNAPPSSSILPRGYTLPPTFVGPINEDLKVAAIPTAKSYPKPYPFSKPGPLNKAPIFQAPFQDLNDPVPSWGVFITLLVWGLGVAVFVVHLVFVAGRIELQIGRERLLTNAAVLDLLEECKREMGVTSRVAILETSLVQSPALYGFFEPRLLLPKGLVERFSKTELRFVFLHELAHVKRHDIAINWVAAALQAIHWFNPLVWMTFGWMRTDRELACDALALRYLRGEERKSYGETILKLLDGFTACSPMPGLVGILENGAEIKGRIRMIARYKPATRWSLLALLLIGVVALVGLTDAQPALNSYSKGDETRQVLKPNGLPADRAHIGLAMGNNALALDDLRLRGTGNIFRSDGQGQFPYHREWQGMKWLICVHPDGVVVVPGEKVTKSKTIHLQPWSRIEGLVLDGDKPLTNALVALTGTSDELVAMTALFYEWTDAGGRVVFERVPAGEYQLARQFTRTAGGQEGGATPGYQMNVSVQPGETIHVTNGGGGATVIGRTTLEAGENPDWSTAMGTIFTSIPAPTDPKSFANWNSTPDGRKALQAMRHYPFRVSPDGTFRVNGVPAGRYQVRLGMSGASGVRAANTKAKAPGGGGDDLIVPESSAVANAKPVDLGMIVLKPIETNAIPVQAGVPVGRPTGPTVHYRGAIGIAIQGRVMDAETGLPIPRFKVFFGNSQGSDGFGPPDRYQFPPLSGEDGHFRMTRPAPFPAPYHVVQVQADGYLPVESTNMSILVEAQKLELFMKKGTGPKGVVLLPDGKPAIGARVILCGRQFSVYMDRPGEVRLISGPTPELSTPNATVDEAGHFALAPIVDAHKLVIVHELGYAEIPAGQLSDTMRITLPPYGRVKGTLLVEGKPAAGKSVLLSVVPYRYGYDPRAFPVLALWLAATTDANGGFEFEKVPPGERKAGLKLDSGGGGRLTLSRSIEVKSAEIVTVTLGGNGRTVVGKIIAPKFHGPIDWRNDFHILTSNLETPAGVVSQQPKEKDFSATAQYIAAFKEFSLKNKEYWLSEEARARQRNANEYVPVFAEDGTFRISDVSPGSYKLRIRATEPYIGPPGSSSVRRTGNEMGSFEFDVDVPPLDPGSKTKPLDLGELPIGKK